MKTVTLTALETKVLHTAINSGDPQRGLSISEIRTAIPVLEKLEATAKKSVLPNGQGEALEFLNNTISFKESEFSLIMSKLEASAGWATVDFGRNVVKLIDRLKELPSTPDTEA